MRIPIRLMAAWMGLMKSGVEGFPHKFIARISQGRSIG